MVCPKGQKVAFGTYTLVVEAEYWWENTRQCLEAKYDLGNLQEGIFGEILS